MLPQTVVYVLVHSLPISGSKCSRHVICQPDFSTVEIEEKHKTYAGEERRDKYKTVTRLKFHLDHL